MFVEKVAILTAIFSTVIFLFGLYAARRTREIRESDQLRIKIKRTPMEHIPRSDSETKMAAEGIGNSFNVGNNDNLRNSMGERFAATELSE